MRSLMIAATLAALWCGVAMAQEPTRDDHPERETQEEARAGAGKTLPLNELVSTGERQDNGENHACCCESEPESPWLMILTFAGVAIAAIAIFLTAKLERPWLIPSLSIDNTEAIADMFRQSTGEDEFRMPSVHLAIANHGRVPGWVIEECKDFRLIDGALPVDPPYGDSHAPIRRIAPTPIPNDTPVQQLFDLMFFDSEVIERIRAGHSTMVFFGYVKYRGIFRRWGRTRETRFCWTTHRNVLPDESSDDPSVVIRFELGGPPNWTRYT